MLKSKKLSWSALRKKDYEVGLFQTEHPRDRKGYRIVYRGIINGEDHFDVVSKVFKMFNIKDLIPKDYQGRTVMSGDIIMIVDHYERKRYYQLQSGGWAEVNRLHVC